MRKKVVFLDIDGTITNFKGEMPKSAEIALEAARQNGHLLVPCTGRTHSQIFPWMRTDLYAGIICGAGSHVRVGDEVIFQHYLERSSLNRALAYFERRRTLYYLQTTTAIYAPGWVLDREIEVFGTDSMEEEERERIFGRVYETGCPSCHKDVEKIAYYQSKETVEQVRASLGSYFCVTASSFELTGCADGEVTCAGINKAEGMRRFLEYVGIDRKDTVAVGDGPNDLEMLQYAAEGAAMENAAESLKSAADFVTDDVDEDGLYHAFERFGLI